ncbi:uncharacterized protein LOC119676706 [Teleopsis dalmanni]|uniref:uncharacterized protein LOC119676706 n=1 Tax=Teleopsis dalmanni TaxID=139649 RepID=UPI0018CF4650|nr:uncharacterized protein LOC119676706 [Teleopsis dalmanni]
MNAKENFSRIYVSETEIYLRVSNTNLQEADIRKLFKDFHVIECKVKTKTNINIIFKETILSKKSVVPNPNSLLKINYNDQQRKLLLEPSIIKIPTTQHLSIQKTLSSDSESSTATTKQLHTVYTSAPTLGTQRLTNNAAITQLPIIKSFGKILFTPTTSQWGNTLLTINSTDPRMTTAGMQPSVVNSAITQSFMIENVNKKSFTTTNNLLQSTLPTINSAIIPISTVGVQPSTVNSGLLPTINNFSNKSFTATTNQLQSIMPRILTISSADVHTLAVNSAITQSSITENVGKTSFATSTNLYGSTLPTIISPIHPIPTVLIQSSGINGALAQLPTVKSFGGKSLTAITNEMQSIFPKIPTTPTADIQHSVVSSVITKSPITEELSKESFTAATNQLRTTIAAAYTNTPIMNRRKNPIISLKRTLPIAEINAAKLPLRVVKVAKKKRNEEDVGPTPNIIPKLLKTEFPEKKKENVKSDVIPLIGKTRLNASSQGNQPLSTNVKLYYAMPGTYEPSEKFVAGPEGSNIILYDFPDDFLTLDLEMIFLPYGNVVSTKISSDNVFRRICFIAFDKAESADMAQEQSINDYIKRWSTSWE